jgi:outer membrane protein
MNMSRFEALFRCCRHFLRRSLCLLILGLWFFPLVAGAAESPAPLRLSLAQAVALALSDNPDLLLAQYTQQAAGVRVETAQGRFLPEAQGSAGVTDNLRAQAALGSDEEYRNANLQLSASLNLFNGFADRAGLEVARQQRQSADADLVRQRQSLAFAVAQAFVAVLSNQELVRVAAQNYSSQQDLEQQISAFQQAGVRALTDLYQQQAATAKAQANLFDAERNLAVAELSLLQVLGQTPPQPLELVPPVSDELDRALAQLDLAQNLDQALAARPDLLAQQRRVEAARQQIQVARGGYLPSLDLQATGATSYTSLDQGNLGGQFDDNRSASLGLQLRVPLFDRHQTRTGVAQAQISAAETRASLRKLQQQIGLEVGQALADYQQARQQLPAVARQLTYARQAVAAAAERYRVGATTWVELTSARSVLVQAQGDMIRARYALLLQGLKIGYSRGDLAGLLNLLKEAT